MSRLLKSGLVVASLAVAQAGLAAGGAAGVMQHADNDVGNINSLQRGARNFFNYCAGCHSAKYVRYSRIAEDLGLPEELVRENFMFGVGKVGDTVWPAMQPEQAEEWFGAVPPDLSLTGRARGADWIYSFLMSFYQDEDRELGVNNLVLAGAAMPHVLAELQGLRAAEFKTVTDKDGVEHEEFEGFKQITEGALTPEQYAEFVRDTTNFLDYMGEPIQLQRKQIGIKVLGYLVLLFILAYALKKEFWKDVH